MFRLCVVAENHNLHVDCHIFLPAVAYLRSYVRLDCSVKYSIKPHQTACFPRANMPTAAILANLRVSFTVFVSVPLIPFFSSLHHLFFSNIILIAFFSQRAMNTHAPPIPTGTPSKPPSLLLNQGVRMPLPSLPAQQPLPRSFSLSAPTHTSLASTTFMAALSGT